MDTKQIIKERQKLRLRLLEQLYWKWFENSQPIIGTKKELYGKILTDKHLAIAYLREKGFIAIDVIENPSDPREEKLSSSLFNKGSYKEDETE